MIMELLDKFFNRDGKVNTSRNMAKDRLKMVLAYDRTDISPQLMAKMRGELLEVVARYFELEAADLDVQLDREGNTTALIANVPIRRVKQEDE
ncbi:cell division topological specificity factor MinE [Candidatus Cyanaurora vandensis]|uniref:cell division topological specificity factor MinE n=1 Tax=Candidatus Cyanaurora vandensis TaxID=2714958 RepID=UPI00257B11A8|nr:cell division topological specificity factor MinE [Candidatus Cyanaurora vandensis]